MAAVTEDTETEKTEAENTQANTTITPKAAVGGDDPIKRIICSLVPDNKTRYPGRLKSIVSQSIGNYSKLVLGFLTN